MLDDQFYYVTTQQFSAIEMDYYRYNKKVVSDNKECTIISGFTHTPGGAEWAEYSVLR